MLQWAWADDDGLQLTWAGRSATLLPDGTVIDLPQDTAALERLSQGHDVILSLVRAKLASEAQEAGLAKQVCNLAARNKQPLFLCSSAAVYGDAPGPYAEDDTPHPVTPYGRAKRLMEHAAAASAANVTCMRIGNVAGADALLGPHRPGATTPIMLDRFLDGSTPRRSYIGPLTLARVLADLMRMAVAGTALPPTLNVAGGGAVQMSDVLAAADMTWVAQPAPATALPALTLDTRRLACLVDLPNDAGTSACVVHEWRTYCRAARS